VLAVKLAVKEVVATADKIRVIVADDPDANSANPRGISDDAV
jgi:hypothetical protein